MSIKKRIIKQNRLQGLEKLKELELAYNLKTKITTKDKELIQKTLDNIFKSSSESYQSIQYGRVNLQFDDSQVDLDLPEKFIFDYDSCFSSQANNLKKLENYNDIEIFDQQDLIDFIFSIWSSKISLQEEVVVLGFDKQNQFLGYSFLFSGSDTYTAISSKVLFQMLFSMNASGFVLVHNHPSGNTQPSQADHLITEEILDIANSLGIKFFNHYIISADGHWQGMMKSFDK